VRHIGVSSLNSSGYSSRHVTLKGIIGRDITWKKDRHTSRNSDKTHWKRLPKKEGVSVSGVPFSRVCIPSLSKLLLSCWIFRPLLYSSLNSFIHFPAGADDSSRKGLSLKWYIVTTFLSCHERIGRKHHEEGWRWEPRRIKWRESRMMMKLYDEEKGIWERESGIHEHEGGWWLKDTSSLVSMIVKNIKRVCFDQINSLFRNNRTWRPSNDSFFIPVVVQDNAYILCCFLLLCLSWNMSLLSL
jgi:hypothetical protein